MTWFDQAAYDVRCEWGEAGVRALAPLVDVMIIIDVLSFSTSVDIATSRGAVIYPVAWKDERAAALAAGLGATLAGPRSRTELSLSPASMVNAARGQKIVLPSQNGATLSGMTGTTPTLTGCLRNAAAVARRARAFGPRIGVVPAGERWPDGTLRPAVEDWLGAGAIIAHLTGELSPEANAASDAFIIAEPRLATVLATCASGRELVEQGSEDDVRLASELACSTMAPVLDHGAYRAE